MMDVDKPEIHPFCEPQHCRGIPVGDGTYAGCSYGEGELTPLTGPCDCPVCHGSGYENVRGTFLPHADFGDPECCGCLNAFITRKSAAIVCNECRAVIESVPAAQLEQRFHEMELMLDLASGKCPHCGSVNLLPGFSEMSAFACRNCGKAVVHDH